MYICIFIPVIEVWGRRHTSALKFFKSRLNQHFQAFWHLPLPQLILITCVVNLSCEDPSFIKHSWTRHRLLSIAHSELQSFALIVAGNKVKKLWWMQSWVMVSLRCRCTLCLFAFVEVNGLGECVVNENAQERETSEEGGREGEREGRSPGESPRVWILLANLSTLPPNWQVLSWDELSAPSAAGLICSRGERQAEKPDPNTTASTSRPHKRPLTGAYCKHVGSWAKWEQI